jgi:DNA-binding GntR family transcriptional regulator
MRNSTPLREQAYERIRDELLARGPRAFGGRLVEQQLADELAMSRTPVRDALRRLAANGLIEIAPGGGGYVARRPRLRDVREEYELRRVLEGAAAALAAARGATLPAEALAGDGTAPDESRFHLAVADASGNEVLARTIAAVIGRSSVHRRDGATKPEEHTEDHAAILSAVRRGDPAAAEAAMDEHLARIGELAVAALRAEGGDARFGGSSEAPR